MIRFKRQFPFIIRISADSEKAVPWQSAVSDSDFITEEKADFLLVQAKEQLTATVTDAEALTKTGIYLLGGLLTITSGLVGVTASRFDSEDSRSRSGLTSCPSSLLPFIWRATR